MIFKQKILDEVRKNSLSQDSPVKTDSIDREARTVTLSFGSERPVPRWFGYEQLNFSSGKANLERMKAGGQLLDNHDPDKRIGKVEDIWIEGGRGYAKVRFSRNSHASEVFEDVCDGIATNVSFAYRVNDIKLIETKDDIDHYRVDDFEIFELSVVSVPADYTVGISRGYIGTGPIDKKRIHELIEGSPSSEDQSSLETRKLESKVTNITSIGAIKMDDEAKSPVNEAAEIMKIGRQFDKLDLAAKFIENSKSLEEFKNEVLRTHAADTSKMVENRTKDELGLTDKDVKSFSFVKAINAACNLNWKGAEYERDICEAAKKHYGTKGDDKPTDLVIPPEVLRYDGRRDNAQFMGTGTGRAGDNFIATQLLASSFIDLLRSKLIVKQLGATVLSNLSSNIAIPRQTGTIEATFVGEGTEASGGRPSTDQVSLSPKRLASYRDYSRKLLIQSSVDVEQFLRNDLSLAIALGIDNCALYGAGTATEPKGIITTLLGEKNTPRVFDHAEGGSLYGEVVKMERLIAAANADINTMSYLTNPYGREKLKTSLEFDKGLSGPIWKEAAGGMGTVNGYRAGCSNVLKLYEEGGKLKYGVLFGDFSSLIIGEFGPLFLAANPYLFQSFGTVRIDVEQHFDLALKHNESFSYMKGFETGMSAPAGTGGANGRVIERDDENRASRKVKDAERE